MKKAHSLPYYHWHKVRNLLLVVSCMFISLTVMAQQEFELYNGIIPNSKPTENISYSTSNELVDSLAYNISIPSITMYKPTGNKTTGTAVIICPGGGYHTLLIKREGSDLARAFNKLGITAFVLKYRLPSDLTMQNRSIGPLQDVQQAIRLVRDRASKWGINPQKIGVMGFSAGGHLAASAGTHLQKESYHDQVLLPARPDFMLLINPVISLRDSITHIGSRNNLLGEQPKIDQINWLSNELQVTKNSPPTFLVHSDEDEVVSAHNSLVFYQALKKHNISTELHLYAKGNHGFLTGPTFDEWFGRCIYWMHSLSLI